MDHKDARAPGGAPPFYLLLLLIVLAPLPFGSIYQWSWAALALVVALLLVYAAIMLMFTRGPLSPPLKGLFIPGTLYLCVAAWAAVQAWDVPWLSWAHPIWAQTAEVLGQETLRPISLDPYQSWSDCLKMLSFGGIFWLAAHYGRERERARVALWILTLTGTLYALYGLVAQFTDVGDYLWFHPMPTGHSGVRSTFANRNMYAVYAGFGSLSAMALLLDKLRQGALALGDRSAHWTDFVHGSNSKVLFLITCTFILVAALFVTTSRGGFASAILALLCLFICFNPGSGFSPSRGRVWARLSYGAVALVIAGYIVAGGDLGARLSAWQPIGSDGRFLGYRLIGQAILESPLTGYGAGNALDVYYLYSDGTFWGAFNYAHNLYLGLAVELGVPATVVIFMAVGMITISCLKGTRLRRRDQVFPALGVSVLVLVAVHGLVDSPLILAANAATFSFLLGLAYAQSWPMRAPAVSLPKGLGLAAQRRRAVPAEQNE